VRRTLMPVPRTCARPHAFTLAHDPIVSSQLKPWLRAGSVVVVDSRLDHAGSSFPNSEKAHYVKQMKLVNGQGKTLRFAEISQSEKGGSYWRKQVGKEKTRFRLCQGREKNEC
jgi:hypothetical protein